MKLPGLVSSAASGRVVPGLKIVKQARVGGLPGELLAGQCAGSWLVHAEHVAEEAEALGWDDLGRQIELAADGFGDRTHRVALVADLVCHRAGSRVFEDQPEELGGVEAMHGRPALGAVADIARDPGAPGCIDEHRGKSAALACGVD